MITDQTLDIAILITFVQMVNARILGENAFDERALPKSGRVTKLKLYFKDKDTLSELWGLDQLCQRHHSKIVF